VSIESDQQRDAMIVAIANALEPMAIAAEQSGDEYRTWVVPLLQALEHHVGVAIGSVDQPAVREKLLDTFDRAMRRACVFHAERLPGAQLRSIQ
jgi:hypothetical protein